MVQYKRILGGEKNELSGSTFTKEELEKICDLYIELGGVGIHEHNPKIQYLAEKLNRTIRSVENQLLGFKKVDTGEIGRKNFNKLIPEIWEKKKNELKSKQKEFSQKKSIAKKPLLDDFKFRISAKLKNIIGKELITDDNVAIFELVKNSFDAYAKRVKIIFEDEKITIWDDGKGMDKEDIITKWLFVAYSAKKEGVEDIKLKKDEFRTYRDKIQQKTTYAGAKGIGRFSSDRLGSLMTMITKTPSKDSLYWKISFNWDDFEVDSEEEFIDMNVQYESYVESPVKDFKHGTIIEIGGLRSVWPRNAKLELKHTLEKLINPFQDIDKKDGISSFNIEIISENDLFKDNDIKTNKDYNLRDIVNGTVRNFIFETLNIKTTQIISYIQPDAKSITTELIDRGKLIYKIEEKNPFTYLTSSTRIHLYYLNRAAKSNFTKLMGIDVTKFGSIFLFNNGFRVFPIGEPGNDPFSIDKRKAQGYARFLGTRELIGQIQLWGINEQFIEATSRDKGFIETNGTKELKEYFIETLKKIEGYVEPILWKIQKRTEDSDETIDYDAKTQILELVSQIAGNKNIKLLGYSKDLINIISEKAESTSPEIFEYLEKIAESTKDNKFHDEIKKYKEQFSRLKKEKEEEEKKRIKAEEKAKAEELKRIEAEEKAKAEERKRQEADYKRLKAEEEARLERVKRLEEEKRRKQRESQVRFYESVRNLEVSDVQNLHHQIGIEANNIETKIVNFKRRIKDKTQVTNEEINSLLDELIYVNKKVLAVTRFTTKENFMAAARVTVDDIILFIKQYIYDIFKYQIEGSLSIEIEDLVKEKFVTEFKPIEVTIIIDNLISNSKKKNAKNVVITFNRIYDSKLEIIYRDNGDGLDKSIPEKEMIFERGYTTTRGSGLGLFHVRDILSKELNKSKIGVNQLKSGIEFIITLNQKTN